jgi:hypothetical protein
MGTKRNEEANEEAKKGHGHVGERFPAEAQG